MPRGYWSFIIALGLVAAPTLLTAKWLVDSASRSQAQVEQVTSQKGAAYAHRAREHIQWHCARLSPPSKRECIRGATEAAYRGIHDERNLEAQFVTAIWTHYMGLAAIGGTAFGIIGIFLVLATFQQARRQANAAHAANRPWVEVELSEVSVHVEKEKIFVDFLVSLKNIGRTPAKNLWFEVDVVDAYEAAAGVCEYFKRPFRDELSRLPRGSIIPNGHYVERASVETAAMLIDKDGKHGTLPVVGVNVSYEIGDGTRGTTCCAFDIGRALPNTDVLEFIKWPKTKEGRLRGPFRGRLLQYAVAT